MKVLQINSVCGQGSTGRIAVDLYNEIRKNGDECCIAYGRGQAPEGVMSYRIGHDADVYCHALLSRLTDKQGLYSAAATKSFIKWIKEYQPDVIHLHNIHGYYVNYQVLFQYLAGASIPVIWTLHDCWAFTGHCAYFDYAGCDRWKMGCHNCPQKNTYPRSLWADSSSSNYQLKKRLFTAVKNMTIVTPSNWLADLVKQSYLKQYDVQVIHNGIDLNVFKPTESDFRKTYHLEKKVIILGVASVWDHRKGLDDFFHLSHMLNNRYQIVLVGLARDQIAQLPNNVIGIERRNNVKELAEIYTAADVFVNPTYEDNYPTTNLEAQACGTPVITYRTGGSIESVSSDHIAEKGNIEQVCNMISSNNYKTVTVTSSLDKEQMHREYLKLYQSCQRI